MARKTESLALVLLPLLAACPADDIAMDTDEVGDTDTSAGDSTTDDTTEDETTDGESSSSDDDVTSSESTSDDESSSEGETTSGESTDGETTETTEEETTTDDGDSTTTDEGETTTGDGDSSSDDGESTGDGDGDGDGDGEFGIALLHLESDDQQALYWMDMADPHPPSTAAALLDGPYFPSVGHSDGRWIFARCEMSNEECEGVLFDTDVLPPAPFELDLPPDEHVRDGKVSRDGSALLVRTHDEVLVSDNLWHFPLDGQGLPGVGKLLTPNAVELTFSGSFESDFPARGHESADGSTLVIVGGDKHFAPGSMRIHAIDLTDPQGLVPLTQFHDHEPYSPLEIHLTAEGEQLVYVSDEYTYERESWWVDVDTFGATQLAPQGQYQFFGDWTDDEWAVLWGEGLPPSWFHITALLEFDAFGMTEHLIDFQDLAPESVWLHEGGDWLIMTEDEGTSVWAAPIVDYQPGQFSAIAGAQLGEDPVVQFTRSPDDERFSLMIREHQDLTRECEIVELADGVVVTSWPVAVCTSASAPRVANGHAYFSVTEAGPIRRVWHLDTNDAMAVPEPLSQPAAQGPFPWLASHGGQWAFVAVNPAPGFGMVGPSQPGVVDVLAFDGMATTVVPRLVP